MKAFGLGPAALVLGAFFAASVAADVDPIVIKVSSLVGRHAE